MCRACPACARRAAARLLLFVWLFSALGQTLQQGALKWQVKAAYLFKFANCIEWSPAAFASPDSAIKIGISGADALADDLSKVIAGSRAAP